MESRPRLPHPSDRPVAIQLVFEQLRPMLKNYSLFEKVEIFFLMAAAFRCLMTLRHVLPLITLPFQINYVEGPILAAGARAAQGLTIYPPAINIPYIISPYGPLPYFLVALCVKLFGVGFTAPRILVLVAGIWCAILVTRLVRHWGGTRRVSLAFGLLFLGRPDVVYWLPVVRVDLIGLAFSLTGLYLFTKPRWWQLSIPFFIAGFFCKILLVSAPLACFLYTALRKDSRKASLYALGSSVLGALAFLWAQRQTDGWFAFHTIWSSTDHAYSLPTAYTALRYQLPLDYVLVVLAIALAYHARSQHQLYLPLIYLGVTFITLLAIGKAGTDSNYFLEWEAALSLTAGAAYQILRPHAGHGSTLAAFLPATLAAMVAVSTPRPRPPEALSGCREAYDFVRESPAKAILSENVGAAVLSAKSLLVADPFVWTREVVDRGWSDKQIVDLIRSRRVDLILLGDDVETLAARPIPDRWPGSVANAMEHNYRLTWTFSCQDARFMYRPIKAP